MTPRLNVLLVFVMTCLLWEFLARERLISTFLFPPPSEVVAVLGASFGQNGLAEHLFVTLRRLVTGVCAGSLVGVPLGFAAGLSKRAGQVIEPIVRLVHPVPKIALYPFLLVFLGVGEASLLIVPALSAFFPMFVNTNAGVRQIRPVYFDLVRTCGGQRWHEVLDVALPGSLPNILAGARLALNTAFVTTIGVEMLSSSTGLGSQLWLSRETLRMEMMWGLLFVISILGATLTAALQAVGRLITPWSGRSG